MLAQVIASGCLHSDATATVDLQADSLQILSAGP